MFSVCFFFLVKLLGYYYSVLIEIWLSNKHCSWGALHIQSSAIIPRNINIIEMNAKKLVATSTHKQREIYDYDGKNESDLKKQTSSNHLTGWLEQSET